jgi:hypothetical protein
MPRVAYQLINPSDSVWFLAASDEIAVFVWSIYGSSAFGIEAEGDRTVVPIMLLGIDFTCVPWTTYEGLDAARNQCWPEIADALETVVYARDPDEARRLLRAFGGKADSLGEHNDARRTSFTNLHAHAAENARRIRQWLDKQGDSDADR